MVDLWYTFACLVSAMPLWKQVLVAAPCTLVVCGVLYLMLWAVKVLLFNAAEAVGIHIIEDDEDYDARWMDRNSWRATR